MRIVDLGTGSGCLLVALLHELPQAIGVGIDRSPRRARTARLNARRNGVRPAESVRGRPTGARRSVPDADLIVSNPPYIASDVVDGPRA